MLKNRFLRVFRGLLCFVALRRKWCLSFLKTNKVPYSSCREQEYIRSDMMHLSTAYSTPALGQMMCEYLSYYPRGKMAYRTRSRMHRVLCRLMRVLLNY